MKYPWFLPVCIVIMLASCKNSDKDPELDQDGTAAQEMAYSSYGEDFSGKENLTASQMEEQYNNLGIGDTVKVSFVTTVNSVCKNKGCWMTLDMPEEEEDVMVKFKDYGFFVPKDIENREVVVHGKAYVTEVSVDEQRHYAEDEGATVEEIQAIEQPKKTLSFLADGVLLKE